MTMLLPDDPSDERLAQNVRPPDWTNPTPDGPYQLVVIGAGTAGLVAAAGAAGLGAKVALIECDLMGGDCLNVGCVPSKGVIAAARVAATVRNAAEFAVHGVEGSRVDFPAVMRRMRKLRAGISRHDAADRFRKLGVDVYFGQARFTGSQAIEVAGREIQFRRAVIATGTRPAVPSIPGLLDGPYLTNETVFSLTELPTRFGMIGAGPIGTELAQAFARLGSQVFLVESGDRVLTKEDPEAAEIVYKAITRDGVKALCCGRNLKIGRDDGIRLTVDSNGVTYDEPVDQLLVAAGRTANTEDLQLDAAGVDHDEHGVRVDDHLRTTNPMIFAAGDVCSKYRFTHAADFMARIVIQNALFAVGPLGKKKFSDLIIPRATYTTPEVAHVGLDEHEPQESGVELDTYVQLLSEVDRAILEGAQDGFVKIHVRQGTDRILGATIVAENAGDLISVITLAMKQRIGLGKIADVIHPYPTQAEAIRKLGDQYNRSRLTPKATKFLGLLRRWNVGR